MNKYSISWDAEDSNFIEITVKAESIRDILIQRGDVYFLKLFDGICNNSICVGYNPEILKLVGSRYEYFNWLEEYRARTLFAWYRTLPGGLSKTEHYNTLPIEEALQGCSEDTSIMISTDVYPIFTFLNNFKHEETSVLNGNYLCGYYKNIPVYCDATSHSSGIINIVSKTKCATILVN